MARTGLGWIEEALETLERQDLRRHLVVRDTAQAARATIDDTDLINFSSNDYLALAADPRLIAAGRADARSWGSGASPLVTGRSRWHAQLERDLASFEACEASLLFTSGYAANVGAIAALVGPPDVVFSDAKNHASIVDGCRLSRAEVRVYRHNDLADAQRQLREATHFRRRLIVSDTLFSMDGNCADVAGLAQLAQTFDCMLMVDEAHATGVFGKHGRGVCELQGVDEAVDVRIGTLSKALGSHGGFVVGSQVLIDWLANRARSYVFSTASPDPLAAAGSAALRIVRDEPERREVLQHRAAWLREQLARDGWNTGRSTSQIVPIVVGAPRRALQLSAALRERGLLVPAIRPPSVPEGESLLRVSVTYGHDEPVLSELVNALRA